MVVVGTKDALDRVIPHGKVRNVFIPMDVRKHNVRFEEFHIAFQNNQNNGSGAEAVKESLSYMFSRFDRMPECDGQTEGHIATAQFALCVRSAL